MRIEILCTGDEILTGKTVNTNYSHIARRLGEAGLAVAWGTTVGDDPRQLAAAFREASKRAGAVIVNGGLGPTVDDLSQEIAAEVAGVELELDVDWLERIQRYYTTRGRVMPPNNRKQAMLPAGAERIDNPIGTACGFALTIDHARFFFTPGVPRELKRMLDEQILPRLRDMSGVKTVTRLKRFHTFGIGESRADGLLDGVEAAAPDGSVKLGFQSHYPQLETKLSVRAPSEEEIERNLQPVTAMVRERLGNFIVAEDEETLEQRIAAALRRTGGMLATLETLTGGRLADRILSAGDCLKRGIVSMDLDQLADAAGMAPQRSVREVCTATAAALAAGLRAQSGATHALAVLTVLDRQPDVADAGGDLFIAIDDGGSAVCRRARLLGGRDWIRLGAIEMGLDCLRRHLYGLPVDERIDFEKH